MVFMSSFIVLVVVSLFFILSYKSMFDAESSSSYECGFDINSMSRSFFSYRFFLISILFLIFDVEIVLMLVIPFMKFSLVSMNYVYVFILVLILGLMYEYNQGSLSWL